MKKIGCDGVVKLHSPEERFSEYGIQIMVFFLFLFRPSLQRFFSHSSHFFLSGEISKKIKIATIKGDDAIRRRKECCDNVFLFFFFLFFSLYLLLP